MNGHKALRAWLSIIPSVRQPPASTCHVSPARTPSACACMCLYVPGQKVKSKADYNSKPRPPLQQRWARRRIPCMHTRTHEPACCSKPLVVHAGLLPCAEYARRLSHHGNVSAAAPHVGCALLPPREVHKTAYELLFLAARGQIARLEQSAQLFDRHALQPLLSQRPRRRRRR